ncbi:NifU family protein [Candidatus Sulfurimonas marisnigri]|uniref:NifU family protein n=1 Tax=Candidatus Sulfurimonas marisnigri TaxID=2740405 RepID=A0A7S7M1F4_9BACT|nr:NifU family protein [Candidatus Sulfurimonas marisnigri]QOY55321.1 NifU family protein [Candidatus Sulfurimonas marisnigri]
MEKSEIGFESMSVVQKINAIDVVIDEKIREFLQADNGDLDFIDLKETNGLTDVYISYVGACGSCESSGGTLRSITRILNGQLETDTIRVYVI